MTIYCIRQKHRPNDEVKMTMSADMIADGETIEDFARRLVGERAKIYNPELQHTHTATLSEYVCAGGCDYPFAVMRITDIVPVVEKKTGRSKQKSCRDCGAYGPVDARGYGYCCGCALE